MKHFRFAVVQRVLCLALLATTVHAADDNRPAETAGIWVQPLGDALAFQAHPAADTALKAKKITVLGSTEALASKLAERWKSNGAIVIVDGAAVLANPTEAQSRALALVRKHGRSATYLFLEGSSNHFTAAGVSRPLRASGPINACGVVERALREAFPDSADLPTRITLVTAADAERTLQNEQLGKTHLPSTYIPWTEGHVIVPVSGPAFQRTGIAPTPVVMAILKAVNERHVASLEYEVLGGESPVVGHRLLCLASEIRAGMLREIPFRIRLYARGEDPRAAIHALVESRERWLASLTENDHLAADAPRVHFTVTVEDLYESNSKLDSEREVVVRYRKRGYFSTSSAVATFKIKLQGGRIYVDSPAAFPEVKISGNKAGEAPIAVAKGISELAVVEGPAVEAVVHVGTERKSFILVDPRDVAAATKWLYPAKDPDFGTMLENYARAAHDAPAPRPVPTGGGAAVLEASPLSGTTPIAVRPAPRRADPAVFEPLKPFFPPLTERIRRGKIPYDLPSGDGTIAVYRQFERSILVTKKGLIVVVVPDGINPREALNRILHEITVVGSMPGFSRNQHFAELRSGLVSSKWANETDNRLEIANAVAQKEHVYLVNYDLTTLTDLGRHSESSTNALTTLQPSMENGTLTLITVTTEDGLERFLKRNSSFRTQVAKIRVPEPKDADVFKAMDAYADRENQPRVPDALKSEFVEISNRFSARGGQPERVLDFLSGYYWTADDLGLGQKIDRASMEAVARAHYGLTAEDFDPELKRRRIDRVQAELEKDIVGMEDIRAAFVEYMQNERRLFYRGRRYPSFLLCGPPGLAKTYILRKFAKGIVGDRFHEINMGGAVRDSIPVLYRAIADAVSKNADAVIFLDEIEKASLEVQESLLKPMWDRVLDYQPDPTSTAMERISLKSVRFFAASNAGTEYLQQSFERYDPVAHKAAVARGEGDAYLANVFDDESFRDALKRRILDSLLSRFENFVFPVPPHTPESFERLVVLKVRELERELAGDKFIGPLQVVDAEAFAKEFTREVWKRNIDFRKVEGLIRVALLRALRRAQDVSGRQPATEVDPTCLPLMVKLGGG